MNDYIRNVYRSAILYAAGKARPEKEKDDTGYEATTLYWEMEEPNEVYSRGHSDGFNAAVDEYESNLRKLAGETGKN